MLFRAPDCTRSGRRGRAVQLTLPTVTLEPEFGPWVKQETKQETKKGEVK